MSDKPTYKTILKMVIWDGVLSFDREDFSRHDEDLASWLDNVSPEDLMRGRYRFYVPVRVDWSGFDDGPVLFLGATDE